MTRPMILIVDDHQDCADALGGFMEMLFPGPVVTVAYGGQEALEQASKQRPDIALLDMEMPGMDGEALARALRALFADQTPLLIAVSGNVLRLEEAIGHSVFDHCMTKPIDVDALTRMVGNRLAMLDISPDENQ